MKFCALFLATILSALAQMSSRTTYFDGAGQPMSSSYSNTANAGTGVSRTEKIPTLNGRLAPSESVEERVVRKDEKGQLIERIVRRYDMAGNPLPVERVTVEEEKLGPGAVRTRTSVFRSDMNGNTMVAERTVSESRTAGDQTTIRETVERPSMNGTLEVAEKRNTEIRSSSDDQLRNTSIYARDQNGNFVEAEREVAQTKSGKSGSVENLTIYGTNMGRMELLKQVVKRTEKAGDGSEQIVVDDYAPQAPGIASPGGEHRPQLRQQNVITRVASGGTVRETETVRRSMAQDPGRLGPSMKVSETVCTGNCK